MSKVAELAYDIEQLYIDGLSARQISRQLECPVDQVLACLESMGVEDSKPASESEAVFQWMIEELSPFETMNS